MRHLVFGHLAHQQEASACSHRGDLVKMVWRTSLHPPATVSGMDTVSASSAPGTGSVTDVKLLAATEDITDDEDRDLVRAELETIPGQPRYW